MSVRRQASRRGFGPISEGLGSPRLATLAVDEPGIDSLERGMAGLRVNPLRNEVVGGIPSSFTIRCWYSPGALVEQARSLILDSQTQTTIGGTLVKPSACSALLLVFACSLPCACSRESTASSAPGAPSATESRPAPLAPLPIEMKVAQRTTTDVPGARGGLRLTIDDVTRGQVMASLADAEGHPVLSPTSFAPGSSASFEWGGRSYSLALKSLANSLIGADHATLAIEAGRDPALSEVEKIERLLADLESLPHAVFIRNGSEHSAKDAVAHLRRKWKSHGAVTARQFVTEVATASSTTGESYEIRFADRRTVRLGDHLLAKLAELDKGI